MEGGTPINTDNSRETIRRWIQAWNERNLAAIDDLFTPDYTVNGTLVTPEGVKKAVLALHGVFQEAVISVEEMVAEGERIAVRWTLQGIHGDTFMGVPATGKPVSLTGVNLYRLVDGRMKENYETVDVYGLLQQISGGT